MFEQFIARILGMEQISVSNRLENAVPSVSVKKDSNRTIPEKYKKDIVALQEKYGSLSSLAGLSINLTLKEALEIMPRERRRVDAYEGLKNYLKREYSGKIGVCCHSGLAERNAEYHVNSIFYRD